jgi:hypothetical protein
MPVVRQLGVGLSCRSDGFQGDLVAKPLELANQLPLVVLGGLALLEVVIAQLLIGHALVQDVVGDYQDRMRHGHGGLARPPATPQAVVLGAQVGALGPAGRLGDLAQAATQPLGALAGPPRPMLAGRLVVARAHPCPGGQVRRGGELAHVRADLGQDHLGGAPVDPGDGVQQR